MTVFEVAFSPDADADFEAILHFIAADSPERAIAFIDRLEERIRNLLSQAPFAGTAFGKHRFTVFSSYVVVYSVDEDARRVHVVLVAEGHRDWRTLLQDRG